MDDNRATLYASISHAGYDGWRTFSGESGVTITALVDAIGNMLANEPTNDETASAWLERAVAAAKSTAAERRSRRRPPD